MNPIAINLKTGFLTVVSGLNFSLTTEGETYAFEVVPGTALAAPGWAICERGGMTLVATETKPVSCTLPCIATQHDAVILNTWVRQPVDKGGLNPFVAALGGYVLGNVVPIIK